MAAPPRDAALDRDVEQRLPPTAPRGAVEVSLLWDDHADLDLIVDCPGGGHLSQGSPGLEACGGRLLEDVNRSSGPLLDHPIEHAAWDHPAPGRYAVRVNLFGYNDGPEGRDIPFTIRVRRGGSDEVFDGHVTGTRATVTAAIVAF